MKWIVMGLKGIAKLWFLAGNQIRRFDRSMRDRYRPNRLAWAALLVMALLMSLMLFVPPYLGLSNDGSFDAILSDTGLSRMNPQDTKAYFNYYERTYRIDESVNRSGTTPLPLQWMISFAIGIDTLFTNDTVFDLRFLAALYMFLYLALLYPFLHFIFQRVPRYSEGLLLAAMSVLVFADSTMVVRFASLYTSPLEGLALLALLDVLFLLSGDGFKGLCMVAMGGCVTLLTLVNKYCALLGIVASLVYWKMFYQQQGLPLRMLSLIMAIAMSVLGVVYTGRMIDKQTSVEKYNQMTRGVLFQADIPTKALEFFGIDARYSVLTDTYGDQEYPVVLPDEGLLDQGFFDHYDTPRVLFYYLLHPTSLLGMFDRGVHQAFISRSDYSGTYEESVGLPPKAKTPFMSVWSTFKEQSAPKTVGTVLLIAAALLRKSKGKRENQVRNDRYRRLLGVFIMMAVLEMLTVLLMSGDSELLRERFLMGMTIDLLFVLLVTELLHRTKSIDVDEESVS